MQRAFSRIPVVLGELCGLKLNHPVRCVMAGWWERA